MNNTKYAYQFFAKKQRGKPFVVRNVLYVGNH